MPSLVIHHAVFCQASAAAGWKTKIKSNFCSVGAAGWLEQETRQMVRFSLHAILLIFNKNFLSSTHEGKAGNSRSFINARLGEIRSLHCRSLRQEWIMRRSSFDLTDSLDFVRQVICDGFQSRQFLQNPHCGNAGIGSMQSSCQSFNVLDFYNVWNDLQPFKIKFIKAFTAEKVLNITNETDIHFWSAINKKMRRTSVQSRMQSVRTNRRFVSKI